MDKETYDVPTLPGLTLNENIDWAVLVDEVIWNGKENKFEMKTSNDITREMCDHQIKRGKDKDVIWAVDVISLSLVDMEKLQLIATRMIKKKDQIELDQHDTIHMSWEFELEEVFNSDKDVKVIDNREGTYKITMPDEVEQ